MLRWVIKMNTYKAMISYTNGNCSTQHYVMRDIDANNVSEVFALAIDDFFNDHGCCGITKVVVELQQSMGESDDKRELIWEFRQIIFKLVNDMLNEGNSDIDIAKSLRIDIKLIDEILEYYRNTGKQNEHIKELEDKLAAYYGGEL